MSISLFPSNPSIIHLCFADDVLIPFKATCKQVKTINKVINTYGDAIGQRINYQKFVMFLITKLISIELEELLRNLNFNIV